MSHPLYKHPLPLSSLDRSLTGSKRLRGSCDSKAAAIQHQNLLNSLSEQSWNVGSNTIVDFCSRCAAYRWEDESLLRCDGEPNFRFSVRSSVQRTDPPVKISCTILTDYRRAHVVSLVTCASQVCTVRSRGQVGAVSQVVRIVLLETMHVHSHLVSVLVAVVLHVT